MSDDLFFVYKTGARQKARQVGEAEQKAIRDNHEESQRDHY